MGRITRKHTVETSSGETLEVDSKILAEMTGLTVRRCIEKLKDYRDGLITGEELLKKKNGPKATAKKKREVKNYVHMQSVDNRLTNGDDRLPGFFHEKNNQNRGMLIVINHFTGIY